MQINKKYAIIIKKKRSDFMKLKIKVTTNDEINIYDSIKTDNKIIYGDKTFKVMLDLKNQILEKQTLEYKIKLSFKNDRKTEGYLNINNNKLALEILTNDIKISDDLVLIDYEIITTNEKVLYKVEVVYE